MRACVVGAGAIGGWVAAELALAGADVSVLARGATLQAIDGEGLRLTENGNTHCVAVSTAEEPSDLGEHDLVIVAVKAPALPAVAPTLAPLIGSGTIILPMLNGVPWWFTEETLWSVDPHCDIANALPFDQVVGCVVHASCRREAPNNIHVVHSEKLILGEPVGGTSERVERLCGHFTNAGINCEPSDNVRQAIWYKLWGNATINPLSALTRSTSDKLLHDEAIRAFMAEAMDELAAVGAAVDCPISESAEDRMAVTARLGAFKSSMLQDVEARQPIEIEALLGAPREIARRIGVPTPQLDWIYAIVRLMAENLKLL
jgi:2-dehydropantoate 2-reductase